MRLVRHKRVILLLQNPAALEAAAEAQNIPLRKIGMTTSMSDLQFADGETISLVDIAHAYEATLPQVGAIVLNFDDLKERQNGNGSS